jgi:hypothetical protein
VPTTKELFYILLGILVGLVVMVIAANAHDSSVPECYITGHVFESPKVEEAELHIEFPVYGCEKLKFAHFERRIVIESPKFRVEIDIPKSESTNGWVQFRYIWGKSRAYIGTKEVAVVFSPLNQAEGKYESDDDNTEWWRFADGIL